MDNFSFSKTDRLQMERSGILEEQVQNQIAIFRKASCFMQLKRACSVGDGIQIIESGETEKYLQIHRNAADAGRFLKFVPASGAATRMFKLLFKMYRQPEGLKYKEIAVKAKKGGSDARDLLEFINKIGKFSFFKALKNKMADNGHIIGDEVENKPVHDILEYILTDKGLNYGSFPKGLLPFHQYPDRYPDQYPEENRTAFEEHLVEAAHYVKDKDGRCRLHFTISADHEKKFQQLLKSVKPVYEKRYDVTYDVSFSTQKDSTDTIAVDSGNNPFRDNDGRLVFRPAGHGALLENLNDLKGDLIYIKNIDNVVPDHLKTSTILWKKILGGYLVEIQESVRSYLSRLKKSNHQKLLQDAAAFIQEKLFIVLPETYKGWSLQEKQNFLIKKLNRPIRVCGMVKNVGEPGGGPFWVEEKGKTASMQIIESAQIDFNVTEQNSLWNTATHFNPVDLVCAVKNDENEPFNLKNYTDPDAVFISKKTKDGKNLKALELPGLWNGSMSNWITLFVEVPKITFNPVKTIKDLLRPEHQPAS